MKVTIVGGSIGSLVTGLSMLKRGFDVNIFERSPSEMQGRGAGLVIQPGLKDFIVDNGLSTENLFGISADERQILNFHGDVISRYNNEGSFSSWSHLWKQLKNFFPDERYHYGNKMESFKQVGEQVFATFDTGWIEQSDLLVGADGYNSQTRSQFLPQIKPVYAGYIAYRGLIDEKDLSDSEINFFDRRFTFFPYEHSHLLSYLVPGRNGEVHKGHRRLNWVWFVNKSKSELQLVMTDKNGIKRDFSMPSGYISEQSRSELHIRAKRELPAVLADRVLQTTDPFVQAIIDMEVPRMYDGRVALIGDAAFLLRPHTAAGTVKAYEDGVSLSAALSNKISIEQALGHWNQVQMDYAKKLVHYGKVLAAQSGLGYLR